MNAPYTNQPIDALMAAEASMGLAMTALLWARPLRPRVANLVMLAAIWLVVWTPIDIDYLRQLGVNVEANHTERVLKLSALLAALATVMTGRAVLAVVGLATAGALWKLRGYITQVDHDVSIANLTAFGLVIGVHYRTLRARVDVVRPPHALRPRVRDDIGIFVAGTTLAAVVAVFVLHRHTNSGDEWAYTYQGAVFAKLRAYAALPPCSEAFRSFWVFQYLGRSFAQYTPGWPLFIAPFIVVGAAWLAGPFALGLLAVGVARLSRRAAAGFSPGTVAPTEGEVRAAGIFGGLAIMLGATMLINGASRYPHIFVAALLAWSVEALLRVADRSESHRAQWTWGAILGTSAALLLATRPADGAALGIGLFTYFVYAAVRRRFGLRALAGGLLGFAFWGGLTLIILRLQLGVWWKTGYSLTETYYSWLAVKSSMPKPDDIPMGIPLAAGSFCWWPCSPAIGLAGLATLRGRARRIAVIFVVGFLPFLAFYASVEGGGGIHWGYGPRYVLPTVVPMAVGTAVLFAQLWSRAVARGSSLRALAEGGPAALALTAAVVGIVRIAPLLYPYAASDVRDHNKLNDALEKSTLHNAVILAHGGISNTDSKDLTEDLPLDLYPNQDILIAINGSPDLEKCVKEHFPNRKMVQAVPAGATVRLDPE